jgi:penicillin-binding protein 1C
LNIPAVAVLDQVGPVRFVERLRRHGLRLDLPRPEMPPGLAVALGGVGTTLEDVTRAYAALGSDGVVRPLIFSGRADEGQDLPVLHGEATRADILTILRRVPRAGRLPAGRILKRPEVLAVKTGTSYGFRDAWAFGVNAHYTIGVWVGRADGSPSPGQYGTSTALPLLFRVYDHVPKAATGNAPPPEPRTVTAWADLPPGLRYLEPERARRARAPQAAPPRITFPADAATLLMPGAGRPIQLEATGGTPPYRWVVNGAPLGEGEPLGRAAWLPGGPGFHDILVMDARGRRDRAHIRLQQGVF